jgi:transketolase
VASGKVLQALADVVPALLAGGADLTSNTGTVLKDHGVQAADEPDGRQLYFGVREHGMAAAMNGMALHGGVLPVGGTFLVFSDYCRPSVRLAALSRAKVIYSFTHDSVGVGEDGPTHQPVEHVMALRAIPGLRVIRPADANETAEAWRLAVEHDGPTALILSRQDLPVLEGTAGVSLARGGHVIRPAEDPDLVLVATGSEVHVALAAAEQLAAEGVHTQVTSLPCWDLLEEQPEEVQDELLPADVPILSVEAGISLGWDRWADDHVAIDRFGASAPGDRVLAELGIIPEHVAERARALLRDLEGFE